MDGNGRWANKQNKPRFLGHLKGVSAVRKSVKFCIEKKVTHLTLYAFSTENWKRPDEEIKYLMGLIENFIEKEKLNLHKQNIKFRWIGRRSKIDPGLRTRIEQVEELTAGNSGLSFNLAFDYGSRFEITNALKEIATGVRQGKIDPADINENLINDHLYTTGLPDVDLIIRTSGEKRISNFLLWQSAYAEYFFTDVCWPDFNKKVLDEALNDYGKRKRRMGGL